jgi:flagellar biosynthesis component FlhA
MLPIQSKKMMLPLAVCLMSLALSPVITHAEGMETGSTAARQAADQKAALARKAADRQKATEEKQKAAQAQAQAQETQKVVEEAPKEVELPK